jgi:hypothetical protein
MSRSAFSGSTPGRFICTSMPAADAELFRTLFDAPETSILTVPGLRLRLERRKADGTWVRVTDVRYRPVAHALYARHSEDTPMLLDRIDLAEAGAIEAARSEALRLVAGEATARTAADAHLQGELAALRGLASPLPADCAAGQLLVADGAGGFGCGTQCSPRQSDCDGRAENACETDVLASMDHCGGCGLSCSTENLEGGVCAAGMCSGTCQPGFADCNADLRADGCERIVVDDPLNCGACDRACSDNGIAPVCEGAECVGTCVAGRADCDGDKQSNGCEGDLASDPAELRRVRSRLPAAPRGGRELRGGPVPIGVPRGRLQRRSERRLSDGREHPRTLRSVQRTVLDEPCRQRRVRRDVHREHLSAAPDLPRHLRGRLRQLRQRPAHERVRGGSAPRRPKLRRLRPGVRRGPVL